MKILMKIFLWCKKHWKVVLLAVLFISVCAFFLNELRKQRNYIDELHGIVNKQNRDMEVINNNMDSLKEIQEHYAQEQRDLVNHYHSDMNLLNLQFREAITQAEEASNQSRQSRTVRYSSAPNEGTQNISNMFGIPIGENQ